MVLTDRAAQKVPAQTRKKIPAAPISHTETVTYATANQPQTPAPCSVIPGDQSISTAYFLEACSSYCDDFPMCASTKNTLLHEKYALFASSTTKTNSTEPFCDRIMNNVTHRMQKQRVLPPTWFSQTVLTGVGTTVLEEASRLTFLIPMIILAHMQMLFGSKEQWEIRLFSATSLLLM